MIGGVTSDKKNYYLEGRALPHGKTLNNRFYRPDVVSEAAEKILPRMKNGEFCGTLTHEQSPTVDAHKISHVFQKLQKHPDGSWWGKASLIESGSGLLARHLLEASPNLLGFSSRSVGATKKLDGVDHVQSPLSVASVDLVHRPASANAFVKMIHESIASDTLSDQELSVAKLIAKSYKPLQVLQRNKLDQIDAIVQAQLANVIDFDEIYGALQNPLSDETRLQIAERIRVELLRKLAELNQREIELQQDQILQTRDPFSYAQHLAATSHAIHHTTPDPFKRATMRKEEARIKYAARLMSEAEKLLARVGSGGNVARDDIVVESIRRNAGTKIGNLREEERQITGYYRRKK